MRLTSLIENGREIKVKIKEGTFSFIFYFLFYFIFENLDNLNNEQESEICPFCFAVSVLVNNESIGASDCLKPIKKNWKKNKTKKTKKKKQRKIEEK